MLKHEELVVIVAYLLNSPAQTKVMLESQTKGQTDGFTLTVGRVAEEILKKHSYNLEHLAH